MNDHPPQHPAGHGDVPLTDAEADELLGAYALDALDETERLRLEAHLATRPALAAEADRLRRAMEEVATADATPPRPGLWDDLSAQLDPRVPSLADRRARRRAGARPALAAAAAVVLLLAGFLVGRATGDPAPDDAAAQVRSAAARAAADPGARAATLTGAAGSVRIVVADGLAYVDTALAPLPEGRTYQLWNVDGAAPVSLGLLGRAPAVTVLQVGPARVLAVTEERSGGSAQPTSAVLAAGELA